MTEEVEPAPSRRFLDEHRTPIIAAVLGALIVGGATIVAARTGDATGKPSVAALPSSAPPAVPPNSPSTTRTGAPTPLAPPAAASPTALSSPSLIANYCSMYAGAVVPWAETEDTVLGAALRSPIVCKLSEYAAYSAESNTQAVGAAVRWARLEYLVPPGARRLTAVFGLADQTSGPEIRIKAAVVDVAGDVPLWEERVLAFGDVGNVEVDVSDVRRVSIRVRIHMPGTSSDEVSIVVGDVAFLE